MSNEIFDAFANEPQINVDDIVSLNAGTKKSTGERFAKATTKDGNTYIKTLSRTGVEKKAMITIPFYSSKEERDDIIVNLAETHIQDDIAEMMDVSQSTVSNVLRKKKKKGKM
ncbi:MAG: hypothetical protein NC293_07735 [Roseburia sp.]|nr:hypothetical protein [Roseburia sp.]